MAKRYNYDADIAEAWANIYFHGNDSLLKEVEADITQSLERECRGIAIQAPMIAAWLELKKRVTQYAPTRLDSCDSPYWGNGATLAKLLVQQAKPEFVLLALRDKGWNDMARYLELREYLPNMANIDATRVSAMRKIIANGTEHHYFTELTQHLPSLSLLQERAPIALHRALVSRNPVVLAVIAEHITFDPNHVA
jgi:hypothetical protein